MNLKKIEFILTEKELGFYDGNGNFKFEPGDFGIMVGSSSKNILLQQTISL